MSRRTGMRHYRVETKQEAVRLVIEEYLSSDEVGVKLGICKAARIEAWVRMYRQEREASFHKPRTNPKAQADQVN